jgi:hypothetical protein
LGWLTIGEAALQVSSMVPSSSPTFCRYCSEKELKAIRKNDLLRGGREGETFFTTDNYNTVKEAQEYLSLKTPPEIKVEFSIVNSPTIIGPAIVKPKFGQPGGGIEYSTFDPVRVIIRSVQTLISE